MANVLYNLLFFHILRTSVETGIGEMRILKKGLEQQCVRLYVGLRLVDVLLKELDWKKI